MNEMKIQAIPFFCFIHIEKTAGSTLHQLLLDSFPKYLSVHPAYLPPQCRRSYLFTAEQLKPLQYLFRPAGIGGHKVRSYLGYEKIVGSSIRYFTFLREPVARYLSQFEYLTGHRGLQASFEEFLTFDEARNRQVRRICGKDDLNAALSEIQGYGFVGLVEEFLYSMRLLSHHVFENRLLVRSMRRNPTKQRVLPPFDEMPAQWQAKILENNRLDIELYDRVKAEIYPRFKVAEDLLVLVGEPAALPVGSARYLDRGIKGLKRFGLEPISYALSKI